MYDSFIFLVTYLNNNIKQKKLNIIDIIEKTEKKYMKFSGQFINFFKNEGKDITIEKLLNSILYMEYICFDKLKENLDNRFKEPLDKGQKEKIKNYFKNVHNDKNITKCEISSALRRFITRFLLNNNFVQIIEQNQEIYVCLKRKYLWSNKIFDEVFNNFDELLKKYLGSFDFPLEVKHSYELYNIIGEEEKLSLLEEGKKYMLEEKKQNKDNIKKSEQKVSFMHQKRGKKSLLKGEGKLKNNK